ncbi:tetratricopeptide repeat protein [Actinoplanes philippinensis]|uniref:tetratricopeptide repeat protein n=1 Tax=Actinoplanes philippinensis TaxID=35752 RepID=UPI0033F58FFC
MNRFRHLAQRARLVHLGGGANGPEQAMLMLTDALADIDPITAPADADLIAVASLYAAWATDPEDQLIWARYAQRAGRVLYGPEHPRSLLLAEDYAGILIAQGLAYPAITLYETALGAWLRNGSDNEQIINIHYLLAQALHADGQCAEADEHITAALSLRLAVGRGHHRRIEDVLTAAAAVRAGCGRFRAAERLLQIHGPQLDWRDYPPEAAADLLARTERDHRRICSRRTGAPDPHRRDGWLVLLQQITGHSSAAVPGNSSTPRPPPGSAP